MRRWLSPCVLAALSLAGCGTARLPDGFAEGQTRIRVAPGDFVGEVPCIRGAEGGLQTYVVSLRQVDAAGQGMAVPDGGVSTDVVSPPVECDRAVVFPALPYLYYAATISGFDRPVTPAEAAVAAPRWVAVCGQGGQGADGSSLAPTRALQGLTVPLRGCTSFSAGNPGPGGSRLSVDVAGALGALRCGSGPGEVGFLEATLGSSRKSALCGQALVFDLSGPARYHDIELTGFEFGSDAGASPPPVQAGAPDGGPALLDAGLPDAAVDAGTLDASAPSGGADAGFADAGSPPVGLQGVARWQTQCLGRSVPGVVTTADCAPLQALAP
jgi:hypothetical protein